ncbi:hypothetical protein [Leptospira santarosai]|nr:hypothetical protein [Leptospira santarosai]ASV12356.1 hypothetical protein B2G51_12410 [Leptospira santarosai]MDI7198360.1 hypothetical protein [Leptospira santarosai]MDI7222644.1 hypothetical protein [Leptospira santarosai]
MEKIKIENFIATYPYKAFPYWEALSIQECAKIKKEIILKLSLPSNVTDLNFIKSIEKKGVFKAILDLDHSENIKTTLVNNLPSTKNELIYINWYRMDRIDQMYLIDLINNFDDIWYPSVDDIDIIDMSISWILSVSHFGEIKLIDLI